MSEKGFMYTDMSEAAVYKWQLDYTMPMIIRDFRAIPEERLTWKPAAKSRCAAQIFGHVAVNERGHIGRILQGVSDVPEKYRIFRSLTIFDPGGEQVLEAMGSREELIAYWETVREQTRRYLDSIDDSLLKDPPVNNVLPEGDPNRHNPVREWLVMTVKHQNMGWGEIHMIRRIIESEDE
jgi:hypothetical protein